MPDLNVPTEHACFAVRRGWRGYVDLAGEDQAPEDVTIDLDASGVEVFGAAKQDAARNRNGQLSYAPYLATWAEWCGCGREVA